LLDDESKSIKDNLQEIFLRKSSGLNKISKIFHLFVDENCQEYTEYLVTFIKRKFESIITECVAIIIKYLGDEMQLKIMKKTKEFTDFMLFSVSHEIRTPINGIMGIFQEIKKKINLELKPKVKIGINCGVYLINQVKCISDFAQIVGNDFRLHGITFNIRQFFKQMKKIVDTSLLDKSNDIKVITEIDKEIPNEIFSDKERLAQILINFLTNSVKYTEKGEIRIIAQLINKFSIEIIISDTGCGFSPNQIYELNNSTRFNFKNTDQIKKFPGFKISINHMILEKMQSKIRIREVNNGSTISFILPISHLCCSDEISSGSTTNIPGDFLFTLSSNYENYKSPLKMTSLTSLKLRLPSHRRIVPIATPPSILIVDDTSMNRFVIRGICESSGQFKIEEASNGLEAVSKAEISFKNKENLLIFMDIDMPIMDGIEASMRIRAFAKYPIIAITAFGDEQIRQKAFKVGINNYLTKPITHIQLKEILRLYNFI